MEKALNLRMENMKRKCVELGSVAPESTEPMKTSTRDPPETSNIKPLTKNKLITISYFEKPHLHNIIVVYYYKCYILLFVIIVNLLLCIIGMLCVYRKKTYIGFGISLVSDIHEGVLGYMLHR